MTIPPNTERPTLLEHKPHRRRHGARNRRRSADHRLDRAGMGDEMRKRAERGRHQHENAVAPRAEAARQRGRERYEPREIETQMHEIGVEKSVREEAPQIGGQAAGKCTGDAGVGTEAGRNEREGENNFGVLLVGQKKHADDMHQHEHNHRREDGERDVEYRLAGFGLGLLRHRTAP